MEFRSKICYFILILVLWIGVNASEVDDCGSTATVLETNISDCLYQPCNVTRETNVSVDIRFITVDDIEELRPQVLGVLSGVIEVPFEEFQDQDACLSLSEASCPISNNTEVVYNGIISLPIEFPEIKGHVKWRLLDQNNKTVTCVQVAAQVV